MLNRLRGSGVLAFISCCLSAASPAAAEWQLEYGKQVREVASSQNEEERESTLSDSEVIVGVGDDYFYIEEGGEKRIFTFDTRRIAYVQPAQKTYQDTSLFSMVAIRSAEFHNRLGLGGIFEAAQLGEGQNPFNRFELEALFGVEDKDKEGPQVEEQVEDGAHRYVVNGEAIVQCRFGDTEVPGRYEGMYDKFVLYETHVHPAIRRKILSRANVIERLEYQYHDRPQASYEVQLELRASRENEHDRSIIQTNFVAGAMPSDSQRAADLDAIIREISLETAGQQVSREEVVALVEQAVQQGRYLEAMLTAVEYSLQTGDQFPDAMAKVVPYAKTDEQVARFVAGLDISGKDAAAAAVQSLDAIERENLSKAHVIDIMKGNAKRTLGDFAVAEELLVNALKANPYMAGVYKDVGDLYYASYDMVRAWNCWDVARKLYPHHPMLQQVNQYEERLVSEYQEYF